MDDNERRIVWIGAIAGALLLFGNSGFQSLLRGFSEKRKLEKTLVRLHSERESLAKQLGLIEKDPAYTEYLIRRNLAYTKKGEVEYRLVKGKAE